MKEKTKNTIQKHLLDKYFSKYPKDAWDYIETQKPLDSQKFEACGVYQSASKFGQLAHLVLIDYEGQIRLFEHVLAIELEESSAQEVNDLIKQSSKTLEQ
jgi:hypothetical protein